MALLASKDYQQQKKLPLVGLNLMQEIITGLGVQCLTNWAKLDHAIEGIFKLLFMHLLTFELGWFS